MGSYKLPRICDQENILAASNALQNIEILNGDFEKMINYADKHSFFYLDPPYKPLSATSNFNSYAENVFDDNEQKRLKDFCVKLDSRGSKWLLSNSDIQENNFFDMIYGEFIIKRVDAKRVINSKPDKRGNLKELLITNYSYEQTLSVAQS